MAVGSIFTSKNEWAAKHATSEVGLLYMKRHRKLMFFTLSNLHEATGLWRRGTVWLKPTSCGFDAHSRRWNIYKYIFPFLCVGEEAKREVDFRHLTRNASRIRQKMGNEVLTLGSLFLPCCVGDTAWSWFIGLFYFKFIWNICII